MAAAAILDFWNREILLATRVVRVETHQRTKFCQNQSICCEDIKIFPFFKMASAAIWIFEIMNFYLLSVSGRPRRITVPNFVKIGRYVVEILRFFEFSRWPSPPSWIFEIAKFIGLGVERVEAHQRAKFCQIWSNGCENIKIFQFFKMAAVAMLYFRNRDFLFSHSIWKAQTHHHPKFCQNWSFHCLSLIHIWRCRRSTLCRSRWSPYH